MSPVPGGSRHFSEKNTTIFLLLVFSLLLGAGFLIKVFQFQSTGEDFRDGLLALQLSRGWLESRPFLYDDYFGYHTKIHNYFFLPLSGVITLSMGIYGFFLLYLGLLAILLFEIILWIRNLSTQTALFLVSALFLFVFGPINFYNYLDFYGWHAEQYFFPLLTLATFYIAQDKRIPAAVFLILALSVKESAPVLVCGILLFGSVTNILLKNPQKSVVLIIFHRRNIQITLVCFSIFIFGMWWLSHQNGAEKSRLSQAFIHFCSTSSQGTLSEYIVKTIFFSTFIFTAGYICSIPILQNFPKKNLVIFILSGYFFVLNLVFFVEGLYYYPDFRLGIPYPARTSGLWTFLTCCFIFLLIKTVNNNMTINNKAWKYILCSFIFQLLFYPYIYSYKEFDKPDFQKLGSRALSFVKNGFGVNPDFTPTEKQLFSLAEKLPKGSEVIVPDQYQNLFQRVYSYEWFHKDLILGTPKLYIYEKDKLLKSRDYIIPKKGFTVLPNDHLLILADSTWQIK